MEDYWNIKIINNFEEYFRLKNYQIFTLIERLWQRYLTEYLDYPGTTFEEYLRTQWYIVFRPEEVNRKIQIWFETRNKIFQ
jgi:hypothetical protein